MTSAGTELEFSGEPSMASPFASKEIRDGVPVSTIADTTLDRILAGDPTTSNSNLRTHELIQVVLAAAEIKKIPLELQLLAEIPDLWQELGRGLYDF